MEWHQILHAVLSLFFVIGLLFLTVWLFKFCEQKGLKCKLMHSLKSSQRLDVVEKRSVDSRSMLLLVRADETEYLLLVSPSGNLLLSTNPCCGPKPHE